MPSHSLPDKIRRTFTNTLILLSMTTMSTAIAGPAESDKQVWTDPKTGLTWSRCTLGREMRGPYCEVINYDTKPSYTWQDAMMAAESLDFAGYQDWRIPSVEEINTTMLPCKYERESFDEMTLLNMEATGEAKALGLPPGCLRWSDRQPAPGTVQPGDNWTSTLSGDVASADAKATALVPKAPATNEGLVWINGAPEPYKKSTPREIMVVRGGTIPPGYAEKVALAVREIDDIKAADIAAKKAIAERIEQQRKENAQQMAAFRRQKEDYENRTAALRKYVKPGDKVKDGLVIEVKGELVKIQTYQDVCLNYANNGSCWRSETRSAGEKWVKRSELLAPL